PTGTKNATYRAKIIAMTAMMPVCIVQNIAQPQRKPRAGEYASRRNTYTPPAFGNADASSAAMSAPHSVSRPDTIHTAYTAPTPGTAPVITDGCTNIEAPMMMPTTSAVAWSGVIERESMARQTCAPLQSAASGEQNCPMQRTRFCPGDRTSVVNRTVRVGQARRACQLEVGRNRLNRAKLRECVRRSTRFWWSCRATARGVLFCSMHATAMAAVGHQRSEQ